jgi:hypothetical protein
LIPKTTQEANATKPSLLPIQSITEYADLAKLCLGPQTVAYAAIVRRFPRKAAGARTLSTAAAMGGPRSNIMAYASVYPQAESSDIIADVRRPTMSCILSCLSIARERLDF